MPKHRWQPVAHFVVIEAWMRQSPSEAKNLAEAEAELQREHGGRSLADIPGSIEMRMCFGVTDTHQIGLVRPRGQKPSARGVPLGDNSADGWQGFMAEQLQEVHRAALGVFECASGASTG